MKTIVDRTTIAVMLFSAGALLWVLLRAPDMQSAWIRLLTFSILSASFARAAYGNTKPPFSREFSLVGFWLCLLAFVITGITLFA